MPSSRMSVFAPSVSGENLRCSAQVGGRRSAQIGLSLTETSAAVAVAMMLTFGAVAVFNSVSSAQRADQLNRDIEAMRSAIVSLRMGQGALTGPGITDALVAANKIPPTMQVDRLTSPAVLRHNTGAGISITGTGRLFSFAVTGLSRSSCINLLSRATGWQEITVSSTRFRSFPASMVDVANACEASGGGAVVLTRSISGVLPPI